MAALEPVTVHWAVRGAGRRIPREAVLPPAVQKWEDVTAMVFHRPAVHS